MKEFERSSRFAGAALILVISLMASDAFALDAYKDRRGIFAGIGLGGGFGSAEVDPGNELTGLEERDVGLAMRLEVGGGAMQNLIVSGQFNWWLRSVQMNDKTLSHNHTNFLGNVAFFPLDFLYVTGGVGMAYSSFDSDVNGIDIRDYSELGFALKGGAGVEFWVNGTIAAGIEASYTRHFYSEASFDTITAGLTVRWY